MIALFKNFLKPFVLIVSFEWFRRGFASFKKTRNPSYAIPSVIGGLIILQLDASNSKLVALGFCSAIFYYVAHGSLFSKQVDKMVGPGMAEMFFTLVENACSETSVANLQVAVEKFRIKQKLPDSVQLHSDKILLLCPDLVQLRSQLKNSSSLGLLGDLESVEPNVHAVNCPVIVDYPMGSTTRQLQFHVLSLQLEKKKPKHYFLCLDQRPLANICELNLDAYEITAEQESYYDALKMLVDNHPVCSKRIEIVKFSGSLETALTDLLHKYNS